MLTIAKTAAEQAAAQAARQSAETDRRARVLETAIMIQQEQECSADEAYRLADAHLEEIDAIEREILDRRYMPAPAPAPIHVSQTTHGIKISKGAHWLHLDTRELEQVISAGRRCLTKLRRERRIARARLTSARSHL